MISSVDLPVIPQPYAANTHTSKLNINKSFIILISLFYFRVFHKVALILPLQDVHEDYLLSLEESS